MQLIKGSLCIAGICAVSRNLIRSATQLESTVSKLIEMLTPPRGNASIPHCVALLASGSLDPDPLDWFCAGIGRPATESADVVGENFRPGRLASAGDIALSRRQPWLSPLPFPLLTSPRASDAWRLEWQRPCAELCSMLFAPCLPPPPALPLQCV